METTLIKQTTKENILSDRYDQFINENSLETSRINTNQPCVHELFRDYEYPVATWPVIIDTEKAKKLDKLCTVLPKLLSKIPSLYFKDDVSAIANFYFEGNEMLTQFALMCNKKNIEVGCRLDLVLTEEGFKVLEANIGSSIGGWQIQSFESIIREMHKPLNDQDSASEYLIKDTQKIYMKFIVDKIIEHVNDVNEEINIFASFTHVQNPTLRKKGVKFIDDLLQEELKTRGLKGGVYTGNLSSLKMVGNELFLDEKKRIHSVLIFSLNLENVSPEIFRAFITDKIYFPDHLGLPIHSDKRNLGILRELARQGKFSPEENSLILDHIPWTVNMTNEKVFFKDKEYDLLELLRTQKEKFVIKDAQGYQGKGVFIGKFSSIDKWEEAIKLSLKNKTFIAQEFSDSLDFLAPNNSNEWVPHKLIWGAFGFGKNYGGVWVRMSEVKTDVGVINSATGAVEAIVYETTNK